MARVKLLNGSQKALKYLIVGVCIHREAGVFKLPIQRKDEVHEGAIAVIIFRRGCCGHVRPISLASGKEVR